MTTENQQTPGADAQNQSQQGQTPNSEAPKEQQKPDQTNSAESSTQTDLGSSDKSGETSDTTDLGAEDEPSGEGKKAEAPAYAEFYGPPETGAYEDFALPDGTVADPDLRSKFEPFAKELGLSQKGAQKLVDFKAEMDKHAMENWRNHLGDLKTKAQADPEIGGAKYEAAVASGRSAVAKFGTPAFRQMLNQYGVGAHPEMIKFMAKIGQAMGETPTVGEGTAAGGTNKPLHEKLYTHPSSQPK